MTVADFVDILSSDNDDALNDDQCAYFESNEFNDLNISTPGNFSIFYMNSRSLCRHFFDIQDYLSSLHHSFFIYGFTETWFKATPPPFVHMENFHLVHSSRSQRPGGGVALFVKNSMK